MTKHGTENVTTDNGPQNAELFSKNTDLDAGRSIYQRWVGVAFEGIVFRVEVQ